MQDKAIAKFGNWIHQELTADRFQPAAIESASTSVEDIAYADRARPPG